MIPRQFEIEIPLLKALDTLGGEAPSKEVYPIVSKAFSQLTDEDLTARLANGNSAWKNRVQWARQKLITKEEMSSPAWGIWAITDKGRNRINAASGQSVPTSADVSLVELYEDYETQFRSKILDSLFELTPTQFEHFGRDFLAAYGFDQMSVTKVSSDGGIDGHGKLKIGVARLSVAFQCKKWEGNIGRPEIDKFRGAIQGSYEQGIFFTTSDFSSGAKEVSFKPGAVPIILLNGESIVDLMIQKEFGIKKRPLHIYEENIEGLFGDLDVPET